MLERVYDKTYAGGLHLVAGRVTDANGVPLDVPPGAPPVGVPATADADARALAADAEPARVAEWEAAEVTDAVVTYHAEIDAALATPVAGLDDFLADLTDANAVAACQAADTRVTAAAHYDARLAALALIGVVPDIPTA